MTFGRPQWHLSYTMMNADGVPFPLQRCYEEQDLGVLFTPNLKFSEHISKITRKTNSVVGIIKRSFSCLDKAMFRTLYVSMVRPHLEYASPNLKFSKHISKITRKTNSVVGIIKQSFSCLDKAMFRTLYVSMVRPHLEYASQIWNPHLIRDIQTLEKVQRRATKLVPELQHLSYDDRISALNLPSLLYRRRRIDMITVFKIVYGLEGNTI